MYLHDVTKFCFLNLRRTWVARLLELGVILTNLKKKITTFDEDSCVSYWMDARAENLYSIEIPNC